LEKRLLYFYTKIVFVMKPMKTETEEKMETIEIDLDCLSKEGLLTLIQYAHEKDLTFNQAIVSILESCIQTHNL